ncbi:MAG: multicomponent Na+:H+ antiporter subunit C [Myxococcota bacterium]|jgi:multicomponent Na+:H+ antiporter subunit C
MTGLIAAANLDLGAYNYWLVIVLMMTGLYVVLARSNMIKTIIGLNMFQVAVILFYVSMGKVSGGTAPIELKSMTEATRRSASLLGETRSAGVVTDAQVTEAREIIALAREGMTKLPDGLASALLEDGSAAESVAEGHAAEGHAPDDHAEGHAPDAVHSNPTGLSVAEGVLDKAAAASGTEVMDSRLRAIEILDRTLATAVIYSNPLPHVLMLTAIVVGIATIALALALVVRINEAYGSIEEDEVLALEGGT